MPRCRLRALLGTVQTLVCRFSPLRILQNIAASMIIDNTPLFNLLQGSKATETGEVIVQAAISDARRLSRAVDITHLHQG